MSIDRDFDSLNAEDYLGRCECCDHGCKAHKGRDCAEYATLELMRDDMDSSATMLFCTICAEDALESGVFSSCCNVCHQPMPVCEC